MRLKFVGKDPDSNPTGSPTVYRTDRESWIVQGWMVTDPEALAQMAGAVARGNVDTDRLPRDHSDDDRAGRSRLGGILDLRRVPGCAGDTHGEHRGHPAAGNRALRQDVRASQGHRGPRRSGPVLDHQGPERAQLAQHLATSWTAYLRPFYHRSMTDPRPSSLTLMGVTVAGTRPVRAKSYGRQLGGDPRPARGRSPCQPDPDHAVAVAGLLGAPAHRGGR